VWLVHNSPSDTFTTPTWLDRHVDQPVVRVVGQLQAERGVQLSQLLRRRSLHAVPTSPR
jgi:hypothetical protein